MRLLAYDSQKTTRMKIEYKTPPNYDEILQHFKPTANAVFVYGDTCYCPDGRPLSVDVAEHELVHVRQQGDDPAAWWQRYFEDAEFRFEQELEAYRTQYAFAKKHLKDRNELIRYAHNLAADLASPMYGSIKAINESLTLICQ